MLSGVESTHYAEILLLSAAETHPCHSFAAIPMAHSSRLEQRMRSILDQNQRREPTSRRAKFAIMAICGLIAFPLALVGTAGADPPAASSSLAADRPVTDQETARFEVNVIEADGALAKDIEVSCTAVRQRGKRQVGLFRRSGDVWERSGLIAGERVIVTVRRGDWSVSSKRSQPFSAEAGNSTNRMEFRLPPMTVSSAKPREGVYFGYAGYMTYVIEIRKGRFRYWFESDAKGLTEPTYPLEGKYSIDGDTITLHHKDLIPLTSIWKFRSVNGIPTLWRRDAIEQHENEPLDLSVEHLRRWGSGSVLAWATKSGEVMWEERTAPSRTAPYQTAQTRPDHHIQISSPTLSSTRQVRPNGMVEYVWTIKGSIRDDRFLSIIELNRTPQEYPLARGYERSTWSKAESMHERKLTMSVHPPVNGKERKIEFTGADTRELLIPDSASVSVTTHQVKSEDQLRHVVNITVSQQRCDSQSTRFRCLALSSISASALRWPHDANT